jgi:hypothetical protein
MSGVKAGLMAGMARSGIIAIKAVPEICNNQDLFHFCYLSAIYFCRSIIKMTMVR